MAGTRPSAGPAMTLSFWHAARTEQLRLELHVVVVVLAKLDLARVGGEAPEHKAVAQTAARHDRSITSARL
jgi:hypothetical protein